MVKFTKKFMNVKVLAVGTSDFTDREMIQAADVSINIDQNDLTKQTNFADATLNRFVDLDKLVFDYGFRAQTQTHKLFYLCIAKNFMIIMAMIAYEFFSAFSLAAMHFKLVAWAYSATSDLVLLLLLNVEPLSKSAPAIPLFNCNKDHYHTYR